MRTKKQLWFKTDLDYYTTEQLLRDSTQTIVVSAWRGRVTFYLKRFEYVTCQVTTLGKFGISYPIQKNPEGYLKIVKKLLVREDDSPITKFEQYKEIPEPKKKTTPLDEKVEKSISHFRFLLMRDPTITEIAYDVGVVPEKIQDVAFQLSPKMKWKEPSEEHIKDGELKVHEIYQTARLLKYFKQQVVLNRPFVHLVGTTFEKILKRTKYALENEQEKLPLITKLKVWGKK